MKRFSLLRTALYLLLLFPFHSGYASGKNNQSTAPVSQVSRPGVYQGYSTPTYKGFTYSSYYVQMRDSILLAVDVYLPKGLEPGKKIPAILYLDRYVRSLQAKWPFNMFMDPVLASVGEGEVKYFTSYGYAVVVVDVRGTGASQGQRRMEFSPEEVQDGRDLVDWIIAQAWSDKNVGTTGISYLGTTAEMLLANQHPAVKACIPRSAIFDLYNNVAFPGGVRQGPFVEIWGQTTKALDDNNFAAFGKRGKLVKGAHPVQSDKHHKIYKQVIAQHKKNFNVSTGAESIEFRDDLQPAVNASLNDFSVHTRMSQVEGSHTPIYRIDGWYDGALAKGCLDASLNTANTRKVLIGPWDHGPRNNVSPYATSKKIDFNIHAEMLRFFDHYLKGIKNGIDEEPLYTYFSVGDETWKNSAAWPPQNERTEKFYLSSDKTSVMVPTKIKGGTLDYTIDYTSSSGLTSGWNSLVPTYMHGPTNYPDRRKEDEKLLSFTSEELPANTAIAGTPVITLNFSADANDAGVFCYLEDVGPDSSVVYVTEGTFRPVQRKADTETYKTPYPNHSYKKTDAEAYKSGETVQLTFDLLPIAYEFKKGHHIRVSIAGPDAGHFNLPKEKPAHFKISSSTENPSLITLPVITE